MAAALLTALVVSIGLLATGLVLGHTAVTAEDVLRHTTLSIFATLLVLLTYSLVMFYLIGKGKAIREAAAEGGLPADYFREMARRRRPVFSQGTLAITLTMAAAIVGGGVDTGVIPVLIHTVLGYAALAANLVAFRAAAAALVASSRITNEVNRLLGA
jgi:hypothetical protein